MKPGAPWSIKGVDADAREIAKAKARASDMTLGQWLNQAISEADKPAVAAPAPQPQAGSSLDTARLMRAISEVARRVDQVRDGPAATVDLGRVEQALAQMARRMEALEQRAPAAPDLSGLTQGLGALGQKLDRMEGRVEGLAVDESARASADTNMTSVLDHLQGMEARIDRLAEAAAPQDGDAGADGDAALQSDMRRVMNGMLNLARKIDGVEAQVSAQLAPLKDEIAELCTAAAPDATSGSTDDDVAIESLREDLQDLKQAIAAQSAVAKEPKPDFGLDFTRALAPVLAQLGALQSRIDQNMLAAAPETVSEPEPEPEPEPLIVAAPDTAALIDPVPDAPTEPDVPAEQDVPTQTDATVEVEPAAVSAEAPDGSGDGDTELDDADDAPMQRPGPGALQALHDLTAQRDTVSRRIEPILRDLPDAAQEIEQSVEDWHAAEDDDRPDFDTIEDLTEIEPSATAAGSVRSLEPEPAKEPETEIAPPPADEPETEAETETETETETEAETETEIAPELERIQNPIDQQLERRDAGDGDGDGDIPEVAAAPDRPRRIVPVESLLSGGGPDQAATGPQVEPPQGSDQADRARDMPLGAPMAAERVVARESGERRRGGGYVIAALLFLGILIGGFFLIGSDRFSGWIDQGKQMVAVLTEMVPVSDSPAPGGSAAPDVALTGPVAPSSDAIVSSDEASAAPAAPIEPTQPDRLDSQVDQQAAENTPVNDTTTPPPVSVPDADPVTNPSAGTPVAPAAPAAPTAASGRPDLASLQAQADAGDAEAQYELAARYRDGDGVGVSYGESASWFQRAAEQGNVPAQVNLGIYYRQGVGVAKDIDLAKVWFHAAARAGHPEAQNFLGQVYAGEEQDRPDYFQAARWFREAAEQGVLDAQYNLASLYMGGLGVPRDDAQAYFWFGIAARQGDADASANQANVAAELSATERAEQDARIAGFRAISQFVPTAAVGNGAGAGVQGEAVIRRRDQIRLIQRLLISRGYDPGQPDGLPGEQTREAIRQFEKDNGLTVTGKITGTVLQALQQGG